MNNAENALHQSQQQKPIPFLKSLKPRAIIVTALLSAIVAGSGGYWLGIRTGLSEPATVYQSPTTVQVSLPPVLSISPAQATATVSWKTYTNEYYGYRAKYPQEFTIEQVGNYTLFKTGSIVVPTSMRLSQNANPKREVINKTWVAGYLEESYGGYYRSVNSVPKQTLEEIVIDGKSAVKVIEQLYPQINDVYINIFIPQGADILEVRFNVQDNLSRNPEKINNLLATFITTFRFSD
jgi:hypothetical protein